MTFLIGPQRESVKDHFVNQLAKNKETYSGHVSKNSAPGIVVRKGCVVTTAVFIELCAGCVSVHQLTANSVDSTRVGSWLFITTASRQILGSDSR